MSCDILKINVDFNLFSMSNGSELLSILKFLPPLIIYLCESSQKLFQLLFLAIVNYAYFKLLRIFTEISCRSESSKY